LTISISAFSSVVAPRRSPPAKSISELRAQRNAELATQWMDLNVKDVWDRYIGAPDENTIRRI
jgi:hypothetical protein